MNQQYSDAANFVQSTGISPGQPVQQTFQQPNSTVQAMQSQQQYQQQPVYQQPQPQYRTITPEEYNRQIEELAENKFKIRAQEVVNNAVSAMKGAINMLGQQQQQPYQQSQESFWDTTTGKVAIGGIGSAIGIGGYKLISKFFGGGNSGGGYSPSPQELNTVGEALKVLFSR